MTKQSLHSEGWDFFISFQLLVFLLEKQMVGQGGVSPGVRRCLHPQNPPKKISPVPSTQQSTRTRSRQRQHIVPAVISCIFLQVRKNFFAERMDGLWHSGPKTCVDVALPAVSQEKSPQPSPRFYFPPIGRCLMILPSSLNEILPCFLAIPQG